MASRSEEFKVSYAIIRDDGVVVKEVVSRLVPRDCLDTYALETFEVFYSVFDRSNHQQETEVTQWQE